MNANLTQNEKDMITDIGRSQYGDGPGSTIWSWDVCETRSRAAILGSLIRKGYASGDSGIGKDSTCQLTEVGVKTYYDMHPAEKTT